MQKVLTVRHAHGGQVDLIPTKDVYTVRLSENLDRDPLHRAYSYVQVQCRGKNGEVKFTYCQFRQPECFDFICQHFGIETSLDPEKRDGFRAKQKQSLQDQMDRQQARLAETVQNAPVAAEPPFPPGLIPKIRYWFANAQG